MREILFRGKRDDNAEWIYGDLRHWRNGTVGIHSDALQRTLKVIPESVGQDIGLTDKNGYRIFEGDVIETHSGTKGVVAFGNHQDDEDASYSCGWYFKEIDENNIGYTLSLHDEWSHHQVIGNIHDNPGLIAEVEE